MDYASHVASNIANTAAQATRSTPELGRLKVAAERISIAAAKVENFSARFHGAHIGDCGETCDKPVDSYRNDISAVFTQIERLEAAVANLDSIG